MPEYEDLSRRPADPNLLAQYLRQGGEVRFVGSSGSMSPAIRRGEALVGRWLPLDKVSVGDVVIAEQMGGCVFVAHRVISLRRLKRGVLIRTQGDACLLPDEPLPGHRYRAMVVQAIKPTGQVHDFGHPYWRLASHLLVWSMRLLSCVVSLIDNGAPGVRPGRSGIRGTLHRHCRKPFRAFAKMLVLLAGPAGAVRQPHAKDAEV